jgi:hypothetical protein
MATEAQQRMLWAVANAHGLTKPPKGQFEGMTNDEVKDAKERMERGEDYFAQAAKPVMNYSPAPSLESALTRLADVLERLEKRL